MFVCLQVGCIIAGIGDLAFDPWAYAFAFSSVISQALYLLLVEFQASGVCEEGWLQGVWAQEVGKRAGLVSVLSFGFKRRVP